MTILLQVVIGGINVDFIAKGKTKALNVSFIYDMESATVVQRRWTRLSLRTPVISFSLDKLTQEVSVNHLVV